MNIFKIVYLKSIESALWGDPQTTTLENRVFNIIMFMVFVVGAIQTTMNIIINQTLLLCVLSLSVTIIGLSAYLYSLHIKKYTPFVLPTFYLLAAVIFYASTLDNGIQGSTPYLFFLPVISANIFLRNRQKVLYILFVAFLITLLIFIEYCFPQYINHPSIGKNQLLSDFAITILATIAIIVTVLRIVFNQQERDRKRLSKAYDEIRVLQSCLPICSQCKKIRDDKGYWDKLESYMKRKSNITFTHGLCPDCAEAMRKQIDSLDNNSE
jgi:hypothetical protein